MTREKMIKKGKLIKRILALITKLRIMKPKTVGQEKWIDTSRGKIRVLEYGVNSAEVEPLYVDMHGGGFILLSADIDEPMNLYLREKTKVKIISIDYPKAPEMPYPIAVEAVYEVVQHYADNAAKYKIDASRIGIGGHSAGANLATVSCIRAKEKGDSSFKFQLLDYPPLDLYTDPFLKPTPKKAIPPKIATIFNACYVEQDNAAVPYVSPVFATTEQLSQMPATLLIIAGRDSLHDEGIKYGDMLKNAGVPVELHEFPNAEHGFTLNLKHSDTPKAFEVMANFINKNI
ncbi:MAG: alpha/beta hydrolase [Clostridiaceae bacterium]|jgi:acetyl esterase|nr:alpha/beta hydrolase [Clostridiaceae bacterium]